MGWFEPATNRLRDTPVLSKRVVYLAISAHRRVGRRSLQGTFNFSMRTLGGEVSGGRRDRPATDRSPPQLTRLMAFAVFRCCTARGLADDWCGSNRRVAS